jgi:diguanylate cyclase (GGDEF)-like protein/PAS domain S-box-containing protein
VVWRTDLPIILSAVALFSVAFELWRFFQSTHTAPLGVMRRVIVVVLFATSLMQLVKLCGNLLHQPGIADAAALAESICLFSLALVLWPFLKQVKPRLSKAMGHRVQRRVQRAEAELLQSKRRSEMVEEIAHIGHWMTTLPEWKLFWSDEVYRIHGLAKETYTPDIVTARKFFHPDDLLPFQENRSKAIAEKTGWEQFVRVIRPTGEVRQVLARGIIQLDASGEVNAIFGVFFDMTEQKRVEEQLRQVNAVLQEMALVDGLTGLPNRRHFDAALEREVKRAIREHILLGLILIDLDCFKSFNDTYGHLAGDQCLCRVAAAIAGVLQRPGDLVARFGGEEMVVLLPNTNAAGARAVAEQIAETVHGLGLEHRGNAAGLVTLSAGVAVFDPLQDSHTALSLVRRADQALYQAKSAGRNRVVFEAPRQSTLQISGV